MALCSRRQVWIAIANGEDAFVVGGVTADLEAFLADSTAKGALVTRLPIGLAAHTPLLQSAVGPFAQALEQSALRAPAAPVVAGIDAAWVTDRTSAAGKLAAQLATTIEWARCLDALFERGCRVFLELGPGSSLAQMVSRRFGSAAFARSVDDFRTLDGVTSWVEQRTSACD
jgi:[acyl-carrier-protein] S-malonyltransferase